MNNIQPVIELRTKKLGVLIYDARLSSHKSVEECAEAMGVSLARYTTYEDGKLAPSLPEIESLAYYLKIPLEHFWGYHCLSESLLDETEQAQEQLRQLRDRIIGTHLRKARVQLDMSLQQFAIRTGISENDIKRYEMGDVSVSLPELEILTNALNLKVSDLFDQNGPIGQWRSQQMLFNQFMALPQTLQQFICQPVNSPYLELAVRLSLLEVSKLRSIAESLLEITY